MKYLLGSFFLFMGLNAGFAQYPPGVGEQGTSAIPADSSIIIGWAHTALLDRGPMDIQQPDLGLASLGEEEDVLGVVDSIVVSLGDGGAATLLFEFPIFDGEGWDFVVFENSFDGRFLELAFVEVSSDGEHFFRFPSVSLTNTDIPIGSFGLLDPRLINNLAGKYRIGYGTPFDLKELEGIEGLDIMHITHVRVVDVVGSLDDIWSSFDSEGRKINDPYPTAFPSGGFDLDAVGVVHWNVENSTDSAVVFEGRLFPNPLSENHILTIIHPEIEINTVRIFSIDGKNISANIYRESPNEWKVKGLKKGIYWVFIVENYQAFWQKLVIN